MALRILIGTLVLSALAPASIAGDVPALHVEQLGGGGGGREYSLTEGWEFDVNQMITVTQLGVYDASGAGLSKATPVAIWDSQGHTLTSAVVPAGGEAKLIRGFRYTTIDPIRLMPRRRYVIGAFYTRESKELVISSNGGRDFTSVGPIRWVRARHGRTEELTPPPVTESRFDTLPGCFGPNFAIDEEASHTRTPKTNYKTRLVQPDVHWQTIVVPEQGDSSHRNPSSTLVCLFATRDGNLTQIVLNDEPLGTGDDAFEGLAVEISRVNPRTESRPLIEIAYTTGVSAEDLRLAMKTAHYTYFDRDSSPKAARGCDVLTLYDAGPFQRAKDNQFVAPDRFRDVGSYIEDGWTGLLWQKDGDDSGKRNYYEAAAYARQLELGELKNWRLPSKDELATIFPANFLPFSDTHYNTKDCCAPGEEYPSYWTSETGGEGNHAVLYQWYASGGANGCLADANSAFVRCVHDPVAGPSRK